MKTGLEEALAECLASLEKGRGIEECLARYPGLALELEPLLRTALGLQQAYDVVPRPVFQQAARQHFLAAVARRGRRPLVGAPLPRRFAFGWRWMPAALGTAALVAFVAWATVLALPRGGGGGSPEGRVIVRQMSPTPTPPQAVVRSLLVKQTEERLTEIRVQVEQGGVVQPEAIQGLREATQSLVQSLQDPAALQEEAPRIKDLLKDQQQVLSQAKEQDQVAPEAADDVDEVIAIAQAGQTQIEQLLSPSATATPTASPTPTPTPTETPAASSIATATQATSTTGTATPASSPTAAPAGAETPVPLTPTPNP